jgi:hypothetical protein
LPTSPGRPPYQSLGFVKSNTASQESVSFFRAGGVVLALWDRETQADDANAGDVWNGNGGMVVAQNVASEAEVDAVTKTFWGGYNGYFADPDGHVWEIAFNPHWGLDQQGLIELPE